MTVDCRNYRAIRSRDATTRQGKTRKPLTEAKMALPPRIPPGGSFIQRVGRRFGTQRVVVINKPGKSDEVRNDLEAQVQSKKAFFDVNAPVYEGDQMELPDPRGGTRTVWITDVDIAQAGGQMSSWMSHIEATFSDHEPRPATPPRPQVIHGDNIVIAGGHVNVATRGGSVSQQVPVTSGYEDLARAVKDALELLDTEPDLDDDDRDTAQEASTAILEEIVKESPDRPRVKKALAALRGVLASATNAAAAAAASGLIQQLVVHH
jgi:hypothetical protein